MTPLIIKTVGIIHAKVQKRNHQATIHGLSAVLFTLAYAFILSVLSVIFFDPDTPLVEFIKSNLLRATATNLLVYALIAVFGYTLVFYRQTKEDEALKHELDIKNRELQKQVLDFKLSALKMQIQPHFLFNSMHSISSLIRKGMHNEAIETISLLSELLRHTLNTQEHDFVKLSDEIALLKKYLSIEKIRFGTNLNINYNIQESTRDVKVPSLILQPIIENIFKHGFKNNQKGEIGISCLNGAEQLEITVTDNGGGLPPNFSLEKNAGIGLNNIKNRLENIYGNDASFDIRLGSNEGTEVSISLPISPQNGQ